jgi:hypothetical protein
LKTLSTGYPELKKHYLSWASLRVPQPEKKYYSVSEAAKKLNVAEITLYRNGKAGKIPVKKKLEQDLWCRVIT